MPTIPTNLQEGKTNVSAGANMTDSMITTGGVMPYVYSLEGTDVAKFTINSTTGRVGVGSTALTAGTYSFTIKVTDKSAKTATQAITLNVAVAEAGIPISASVVGAFQITYTEENIVINLTAPIEGLTDSDIKAYKNGSIISNVIPTRSDTNDKITKIVETNQSIISEKVLADEMIMGCTGGISKEWNVNGEDVTIGVEKTQ